MSISKAFPFEAAHVLPGHPGKCGRVHGHSYRLVVAVAGPVDDTGMVMDFEDLSAAVRGAVVDRVDHVMLNDLIDNPTAENLVSTFWMWLEGAGLAPSTLTLHETATSSATLTA